MKKLLIVLFSLSIAATSMARYGIYPVMVKGSFIQGIPDAGKYIYNGELDSIFPAPAKGKGIVKGFLVEDEWVGDAWVFFLNDEGNWSQVEADWEVYWYEQFVSEISNEIQYKLTEKGMVSIYLEFGFEGVELHAVMNGKYAYSEEEDSSGSSWKYALSAKGAGDGIIEDDPLESLVGLSVDSAKLKYNDAASHQMTDAYESVIDAEGTEGAAVAAASAWLAAFLGDGAEPELPLFLEF